MSPKLLEKTRDIVFGHYTAEQILKLEERFLLSKYITGNDKMRSAEKLGLSEKQVKVWFQNRRAKQRKLDSPVGSSYGYCLANSFGIFEV
ncbi:hypothetical protein JTB14_018464 [Gonioctena quinquepunctata]|nr:hypothetical protein JTB14_018464 [Gonioctena quinquepunctata]